MPPMLTGAAQAAADPSLLGSDPIGLLTNFTGTTPSLERTSTALFHAGAPLVAILGPEHGVNGSVQAGETEDSTTDSATGLPVLETYLAEGERLDSVLSDSGAKTIVFDMQDLGVRYYTYVWTMYDAMFSAARTGRRFVVLDRPNPLGVAVAEGSRLGADFASFVGRSDVFSRHGLTIGEMARLIATRDLAEAGLELDLRVIPIIGGAVDGDFDTTGLPWVPPSPNMPTVDAAFAFVATGIIEGTNVSEGRGTTKPFEMIGAPFIDGRFAQHLRDIALPGVLFRDVWFVPTFHKYVGEECRGVQMHVVDREAFRPTETGLEIVAALARFYPEFRVLPPGERLDGPDARHAIDLLWGSAGLREFIESHGEGPRPLVTRQSPADAYPAEALLYPRR